MSKFTANVLAIALGATIAALAGFLGRMAYDAYQLKKLSSSSTGS
jgi:hypothetical protein